MYGINKELKLHFIGIGGIGMSAIAKVLINLGYKVSGSDLGENNTVIKLREKGALVYKGHSRENIAGAQIVVYSSAIDENNPEVIAAKEKRIPMIKRAEMLAELMRLKYGLAVAGSHGKTTTTSLLATIMSSLNENPTYIVGGLVKNLEDNAGIGDGELLIAEADESDGSFLFLNPIMSVITNIDNDHLDHYGTIENLRNAFCEFSNKVPFYGVVAINANDQSSMSLLKSIKRPYKTFGILENKTYFDSADKDIDYKALDVADNENGTSFKVEFKGERVPFEINLSGYHNVSNALGAIVLAHTYGKSLTEISHAIKNFEGVSRRQEKIFENDKMKVVDDYAHHPTEIQATISTIKKRYKGYKIVVCFEPHRYTRTKNFWEEFVKSFKEADELYISPIYAANEEKIPYIDSEVLAKSINESGVTSIYLNELEKIQEVFGRELNSKTIILTLGAGAVSKVARKIIEDGI